MNTFLPRAPPRGSAHQTEVTKRLHKPESRTSGFAPLVFYDIEHSLSAKRQFRDSFLLPSGGRTARQHSGAHPSYPCPRPGAVGRRIWLSPSAAGQESRDIFSGALTDGRGQRKENLAAFALLGIGKRKGGRVRAAISPVRASEYSLFVLSARLSPQPIVRAFAHLPGAPPGTLTEPLRVDHRARQRADRPFLHFVLLSSSGTLTDRRGSTTKPRPPPKSRSIRQP